MLRTLGLLNLFHATEELNVFGINEAISRERNVTRSLTLQVRGNFLNPTSVLLLYILEINVQQV